MSFSKEDTKVVKGIAICLMLYHHLFAYPHKILEGIGFVSLYSFGETTLSTYIGQFGRICMPMFLFLSGYGTYLSSQKTGDITSLAAKRIKGLYTAVWQVFFLSLPVSVYFFRNMQTGLLREIIYNSLGLSCTFNEEWWFILPFAVLLVLFPSIKRFLDREKANVFTDLFIVLIYSAFCNYIVPVIMERPALEYFAASVFWHKTREVLEILPAFLLGCIFAKYALLDRVKEKYAGKTVWCIAALVCMAAVFYLHLYNHLFYDFINSAVFICCIAVLLPLRVFKPLFRLLGKLGDESAFIWLTHTFFSAYWCQKLIFAPKYSALIFLLLLAVSYCAAKLIRLFWALAGRIAKREEKTVPAGNK